MSHDSPIDPWCRQQIVGVTGGLGNLGRRLVGRLAAEGARRIVVIDRATGSTGGGVLPDGVEVRTADIGCLADAERALKGCTVVFHLAALAHAAFCEAQPSDAFMVNSQGTVNLLEACRRNDIHRFVYSSSIYVYGKPLELPIREDHATVPLSVYGASKLAGELAARAYSQSYGLSCEIGRIANVYGAALKDDTLIGRCLRQAVEGSVIQLRDITPVRDFIHVDDVAEALIRLAASGGGTGLCQATNVGAGQGVSAGQIAALIADVTQEQGWPRPTIHGSGPGDPSGIPVLVVDNNRLNAVTGWKPARTMRPWLCQVFQEMRSRK